MTQPHRRHSPRKRDASANAFLRIASGSHLATGARPVIDGLSSRALSEISRLDHIRNYLQPGDVSTAVGLWKNYVHQPERDLWHDYEWGNVHWCRCGNPSNPETSSTP
ncbi:MULTISPECIES: hypothetical protein [unclassified Streptomyces]|uniref:hypothetical protein n=1 Tax=unclassified Streptomyces TaxID=2593676 RepID=UPI0018F2D7F1|nr:MULTISPECIES: hypothetical protein [unclassified Streptomyces]